MKIKGCIFDLDGVIVDTAKYHFLAWRRLAQALNIPFSEVDNESLKGVSRVDSLDRILKLGNIELSASDKQKWMNKKNEWYLYYIRSLNKDEILPGVLEFLTALKKQGIKIALGSSSKNARYILDGLEINHFFDAIVDGNDVQHSKPHPEVFLKGAEKLGLNPSDCMVFEDANSGVEAALTGGFHVVGIKLEPNTHDINTVLKSTAQLRTTLLNIP